MASMQAELNGAKRVPKTNAKKCMQNRFPNSGPPLYDWSQSHYVCQSKTWIKHNVNSVTV